jgi:hypothetical protein
MLRRVWASEGAFKGFATVVGYGYYRVEIIAGAP